MTKDLMDALVVIFIVIPVGGLALLIAGLYAAEAVRKVWRKR